MQHTEDFSQMGLSNTTLIALQRKGFENPTPIQQLIIPRILKGDRDLVGQAQTGTGKTAAFGIPIIEKILESHKQIQVLVLVPTRELAMQVSDELVSLKGDKKIRVAPIYGGQSIELQIKKLKRGVDIVVGTPGRVLDLLERGLLRISDIDYLVLDEADEMLNMGFIEDVKTILSATNSDRSTLMFSATMPREIINIARTHMKDYELIRTESKQKTTELTDQVYFEITPANKFEALCRIIDIEQDFYGLVFCRTKADVDQVSNQLMERGYNAEALHGDISQAQREKVLAKFRNQRVNILVATDVAARGIDVQNLTHVVNYAIPQDSDSYVHRIGRTGRAGKEGTAITFITPDEYRKLKYIQKSAKTDIRREKLPRVKEIIKAKKDRIKQDVARITQEELPEHYRQMARELLSESSAEEILAALLKHSFENELNPENYQAIREPERKSKGKTRLFVALGKRDQLTKRKLVEIIRKKTRVDNRNIDNVQVFDTYSFITVPMRDAEVIMNRLNDRKRRGTRSLVEVAKEEPSYHKFG